jgi:hypothetical protein
MIERIALAVLAALAWSACAYLPSPVALPVGAEPTVDAPVLGNSTAVGTAILMTYYVRPDGGSATECTGLVDLPYPGSGVGQSCAWDHPFRALQPSGEPGDSGILRIAGGDTLIVAPGSYRMGYGAPGAESCESDYRWDCTMPSIPSGLDPTRPTRILGQGWEDGCDNPPELWGTERARSVLDLTGARNVEIACLEITDHSGCVEDHSGGLACEKEAYPYGNWSADGLCAEDSTDVRLSHLNIHGLAGAGVRAGRLTDWTLEDVRIVGNGWVGWGGDIEGDDANGGNLTFRRCTVAWNGCGETYPGGELMGCWGQSAGGYGDGIGTGATGGDWVIEDSAFLYNTSDGLDLLYHRLGGSVTIRRTIAQGNAGDQIKVTGPTLVENVIAVSHCSFFDGKHFTHHVDHCRAGGSALAFTLHPSDHITVVHATVTGEGDCLVIAECAEGESCDGSESILLRNDIFQGHPEFGGGGDTTCLTWTDLSGDLFAIEHAIIGGLKGMPDPCLADSLCDVPAGLTDGSIDSFDAHLEEGSPAVDSGTREGAPGYDFDGHPRDDHPDIGAYEQREQMQMSRVYLALTVRDNSR